MASHLWAWVLWDLDGCGCFGVGGGGFSLGQWSAFLLMPPDPATGLVKTPGSVRPQVLLSA